MREPTKTGFREEQPQLVNNKSVPRGTHTENAKWLERNFLFQSDQDGEAPNGGDKPSRHREPLILDTLNPIVDRPVSHGTKPASESYLRLVRAHFMSELLGPLKKIQRHATTPTASMYADKILRVISQYEEASPDDPLLEVMFAFYDSLAYKALWATYTSAQYGRAEKIIRRFFNQTITQSKIEKAITDLGAAGFQIIPYELSLSPDTDS